MYYDNVLQSIADIVGESGEVKAVNELPNKGLYTIFVSFVYPWADPIGVENYYRKISELVGIDGDGRVRLTVEPSTAEPNKIYAKITVVFKAVYKSQARMEA